MALGKQTASVAALGTAMLIGRKSMNEERRAAWIGLGALVVVCAVASGAHATLLTTDPGTGTMTVFGDTGNNFNLGGNFGLVGGFMNYGPGVGSDATITALAADGLTVLETYDLVTGAPISTPGGTDAGAFRGISRSQDDIHYLELSGDFISHTLEIGAAAAVPAPLIGHGLPVLLAVGGLLFGAKLLERGKRRSLQLG